ncbi:MAG: hypothetical protein JXA08_02530 [Methanomicrobiaceae archaeon]|nr:hypothetical protein [Methanomicrobiaceae archaeon]
MEDSVDLVLIAIDQDSVSSIIEAATCITQIFHTPVIFLADSPDLAILNLALVAEPAGILTPPVTKNTLCDMICRALVSDVRYAGKSRGPRNIRIPAHTSPSQARSLNSEPRPVPLMRPLRCV